MSRLDDVLYFLRQIFFPNWTDREDANKPTSPQWLFSWFLLYLTSRKSTGITFSVILHIFILVLFGLIPLPKLTGFSGIDILGDFKISGLDQGAFIDTGNSDGDNKLQETLPDDPTTESVEEDAPDEPPATPAGPFDLAADDLPGDPRLQVQTAGGFVAGGGFQNRTSAGRQRAMQGGGGGRGGEEAVERALVWLAYHQQDDGGWSLHFDDSCRLCTRSGTSPTNRRTAATAMALLSFLGAGYSYQTENQYRSNVEKGLIFLIQDPNGGIDGAAIQQDSLRMYSYGLASMALCEAHAMNKVSDPGLGRAAQESLLLIETAQDPDYGGWNYRPGQESRGEFRVGGDTSIFAWQLMALKSGKLGGLNVSQSVLYAAQDFLDLVALEGGRHYQYTPPGNWKEELGPDSPKTCTAIGLLMRMYLGWKPGDPFLDDGMEQLARWGPIPRTGEPNLYYAYYATLALHHYGGEHWDSWNGELQEFLIRTQSRRGCESGSWYFGDRYCDVGGRLLNTALAVMILETPYRYMPLYREIR